jgi:hypothetical protein
MRSTTTGWEGELRIFSPMEPEVTDGQIRKGQRVHGWITFEYARGARRIELV